MEPLYLDNNNNVELRGLKNNATDEVDTGATVTVTLYDKDGAAVTGETWPRLMTHVENGLYRVTLAETINISYKHTYTARVSCVGSGGEIGRWNCDVIAEIRRCE